MQCAVVMCTKMHGISSVSRYVVAIHIICSILMADLNYIERFILDRATYMLRPVISHVYQHMHMNCIRFYVISKHKTWAGIAQSV
jgi:hypothetical protein